MKGYNLKTKKVYKTMSNRQIAMVAIDNNNGFINFGLCIGKTRRQCSEWYEGRNTKRAKSVDLNITGRCGMEGLKFGLEQLKKLQSELKSLSTSYIIEVTGDDEKRTKAYRFITRLGFIPYSDNSGYYWCNRQ